MARLSAALTHLEGSYNATQSAQRFEQSGRDQLAKRMYEHAEFKDRLAGRALDSVGKK